MLYSYIIVGIFIQLFYHKPNPYQPNKNPLNPAAKDLPARSLRPGGRPARLQVDGPRVAHGAGLCGAHEAGAALAVQWSNGWENGRKLRFFRVIFHQKCGWTYGKKMGFVGTNHRPKMCFVGWFGLGKNMEVMLVCLLLGHASLEMVGSFHFPSNAVIK